jgi:chemotaxis protein CheD
MSQLLTLESAPVRQVIGIAEARVSANPADALVTYALGSCLGIAVYDPLARVGGLLHVMLASSTIDPAKAERNPAMFVDTGVPQLFRDCYAAGARKERMLLYVAGGASTRAGDGEDRFQIGKNNFLMLRKLLWKNGVLIRGEDVGGTESRTMTLEIGTGMVSIRSNGTETRLSAA